MLDGGAKSLQQITNRKPADARGVQLTKPGSLVENVSMRQQGFNNSAHTKRIGGICKLTPPSMRGFAIALALPEATTRKRFLSSGNAIKLYETSTGTSGNQTQGVDDLGMFFWSLVPRVSCVRHSH